MSTKPEPDFIIRAAGLFLSDWPEGINGEQLIELLEKDDPKQNDILYWEPFQNCDGLLMAEHIDNHAQALRRNWQEDFDAGMKYVAAEMVESIERLTKQHSDAKDVITCIHIEAASYLD